MDLRSLRYFVRAVEEGSISGAALKSFVAQPSITLAISKLEEQFDCQLLFRHRKGVTPTPKGNELYERSVKLLAEAESLENHFSRQPNQINFRLQLDPSISVDYVERALNFLSFGNDREVQFEIVQDEKSDLRIATEHSCLEGENFIPLAREEYKLLLPIQHWLAHKNTISVSDLQDEPMIERRYCENQSLFEQAMTFFKLTPKIVAQVDNEEWARSLVAAGVGITLAPVPEKFNDTRIQAKDLVVDGIAMPKRRVGLVYSNSLEPKKLKLLEKLGTLK